MTDKEYVKELAIYKAALDDKWDSVSEKFKKDPRLMTKPITRFGDTPLHMAVGTNHSHCFVKELVKVIVAEHINDTETERLNYLFKKNNYGNSPLHFAAMVGNTQAAELLLEHNPSKSQTQVLNNDRNMPLHLAAWHGNKKTLEYLLFVTPPEPVGEEGNRPYTGNAGGHLITRTLVAGFFDVALQIIEKHPDIVLENNSKQGQSEPGQTALEILAQKPENFASGRRLGFWGRIIYSLIPMNNNEGATEGAADLVVITMNNESATNPKESVSRKFSKFIAGFQNALGYVAPTVKRIYDIKENDKQSNKLVKRICEFVIGKGNRDKAWTILGSAIATAVEYGAHELIEECILAYPGIIWYDSHKGQKFSLFLEAIKHRQERVYNLVYQMSCHKVFAVTPHYGKENALHIAGKLAPTHRLDVVTGAALQMQRELQWFQEVENFITELSYKEAENNEKKTPRMVFTEEHKQLLKEGQQWMKDTASSCTVVAALIVTMAFAAAFTLPGGNQDDGTPMFLNFNTFMLFIVSDAIALFSSSTSVLMFLGILTSRYAEADFLYALPKRLTIGLISLFISIAATMIAFSSALAIMLKHKVTWIAAPLVIATSIPVCLFGLLQFPLLVELVKSTYGRSIFHRQNARRIH